VADEVVMFGGEPLAAISDVREPVSIQAALAQIVLRNLRIEMAVLSPGVGLTTDAEEFTADTLHLLLEVNVLGAAHWLEALQPLLKVQPGGATVAVLSSLAADRAYPGASAGYSASKAALSHLCDGLRAPWASQNIRLVTIEPGFVRTPMTTGQSWTPFLMEPEDAAQVILDGLRAEKRVVRFPRMAALTTNAIRLLPPGLLDKLYEMKPPGGVRVGNERE
jgi:NAD(P)-dependent dehydrogenase (short-subunit alcohol dehydrogenase family)